ncbi:DNA recombination protein RmuC [hydrothermal vent metagenome]|uniref:DNA recombination protein RmuC n=1 Tax=hydrothermal vent metagenome TaxID=652676 RepID=A0A1W1CEJ7_9ZZZZ
MDILSFIVGLIISILIYIFLDKKLQAEKNKNITLMEQIKGYQKEIELIKKSEKQVLDEFKKIATDVLKEDKKELKTQNDETLIPLKDEIKAFKNRLEDLNKAQSNERADLKAQIKSLHDANQNTLESAKKLTNALTYDNKQQGDWGEMVLENILESSGLKKGREYETQKSYKDDNNKSFKPDVIVHLPDDKDIIIDSKVSLVAYQNYVETKNKDDLKAHINSIEKHIKDISLKGYQNLHNINTLDYIFVFFPIESSLLVALEQNKNLFNDAIKKNIALVSPSTLIMSLKIIYHIWQSEKQNKNTEEIVRLTGNLYDKLYGFVDSMSNIETQLNKASESYNEAKKRLSDGKGNIFSIADNIKKLGVPTKKELKDKK